MTEQDERSYLENLLEEALEMTIVIGGSSDADSVADGLEMIIHQRLARLT